MKFRASIMSCERIGDEFDEDLNRKMSFSYTYAHSAVTRINLITFADINKEKLNKCRKMRGEKNNEQKF